MLLLLLLGGGGGGGVGDIAMPDFDYDYGEPEFDSWGEAFSAFLDKLLAGIPKLEDAFRKFADWLNGLSKKLYDMFTFPGVLEKVERLEQVAEPDDRIVRQYIMAERATLGKPDGPYSPEERLNLLLEALRITVPNLDLEEINLGLYSMEETTLLNQIAVAYVRMGQEKKAIDIYRQLLKYVQKRYCDGMSRYAGKFALMAHNYTRTLFAVRRYDDALEVAELGRKVCVEYAHYQFLPGLLDLMGGCYFYQGDLDKCKEYYRDAHCLYRIIGDDHNRLLLEKEAKERLGLEFPF